MESFDQIRQAFARGCVIPASPMALDRRLRLEEQRQRALCRYYAAAGAGGVAIGVHTTQFAIRDPKIGLFEPVLALVADELDRLTESPLPLGEGQGVRAFRAGAKGSGLPAARPNPLPTTLRVVPGEGTGGSYRPLLRIAGVCGPTRQAAAEAALARGLRYHAGLLSLAALRDADDEALLAHCRTIADVIPLVGFYLQPAVGGRILSYNFWRRFVEIEAVVAIKIAAFNRYQTLDVVRAVAESGRQDIALFTGNDDHILLDLLVPYRFQVNGATVERRIVGGLLGQWAVWTQRAVAMLEECRAVAEAGGPVPRRLLEAAHELTDANAALFDAANGFAGCIPGIHEILRRQGLLAGNWCLDPQEKLSPGQEAEIDRVCRAYPQLTDDDFVAEHLPEWQAP
jgi:dihydrodipicolinate synthase/N-acetylneuraminate lyase